MFRFRKKSVSGTPAKPKKSPFNKSGHRSGFETLFHTLATSKGFKLGYEADLLPFETPPKRKTYHPDFTAAAGWFIETKGRLDSADRTKLILVKKQHPTARILIIFQRPDHTITKQSKTTYAAWAEKNGFQWCTTDDEEDWARFIKDAQGTKA